MSFGTTIPVEGVQTLATTVKSQSQKILNELTALRAVCARDPAFTGNAAQKYDEYMQQFDVHQKALATNLEGAGQILEKFAAAVLQANQVVHFDI